MIIILIKLGLSLHQHMYYLRNLFKNYSQSLDYNYHYLQKRKPFLFPKHLHLVIPRPSIGSAARQVGAYDMREYVQ